MPLYPNITSSVEAAAGVARAQYAVLDLNGFPQGTTGSISNGQSAPFGIYIAVKKAGGPASAPRTVYSTGDNGRTVWAWTFNAADIARMDLAFGAFDEAAHAAFTGTKIDNIGQWDVVGVETNQPPATNQIMVLANIDGQDGSSGSFGQHRFLNWLWPACVVFPNLAAHDEATPADFAFTAQPTKVGRYPWGIPFTRARNGYTLAARKAIYSDYPLTGHTFVGDGATTTVTLTYSPTTDATGQGIQAWDATSGVALTLSSVNIATRVVTFSSAPTAGHVVVIMYEAFDLLNN